jgi:hypothetical protein
MITLLERTSIRLGEFTTMRSEAILELASQVVDPDFW